MTNHHICKYLRLQLFLFLFLLFAPNPALGLDSESDREKIVTAKSRKFYRSSRAIQSLLLSGNKDSDYNSKSYQLDCRYYYQSDKQMHEINFFQKTSYSSSTKTDLEKKNELYDAMVSNKFMIGESKNYGVLYNRVNYDELSSYYYDLRTAAGFGRIFFEDKIELDASIGYLDIKNSGSKTFLLPSIRLNFPITRNLTFTQRAYWFIDYESMDDEIKTTLKYRINNRVSLALNHILEQRKYTDAKTNGATNQTRRYVSVGFVFDLQ